jgi:hypothetical protein
MSGETGNVVPFTPPADHDRAEVPGAQVVVYEFRSLESENDTSWLHFDEESVWGQLGQAEQDRLFDDADFREVFEWMLLGRLMEVEDFGKYYQGCLDEETNRLIDIETGTPDIATPWKLVLEAWADGDPFLETDVIASCFDQAYELFLRTQLHVIAGGGEVTESVDRRGAAPVLRLVVP